MQTENNYSSVDAKKTADIFYPGAFGSFRIKEYRIYFPGAMIAALGMWVQIVAQGWLIVNLTSSEFLIGLVAFCANLPFLLLSLPGGMLADRFEKRKVVMTSQSINAIFMMLMGLLVVTGKANIWLLMVWLLVVGSVGAISMPSQQSMLPEIVGRKNLMNAIALNSAQFNLTGVIGPTLGGFAVKYIGIAGAYFFNGLTLVIAMVTLWAIRPQFASKALSSTRSRETASLAYAARYVWTDSRIRTIVVLAAIQTLFLQPYNTLLPVFAKDVLHMGASGYGLLLGAVGLGAFVGAMMLAFKGEITSKGKWLIVAQVTSALGIMSFAVMRYLPFALVALFVAGWGIVTFLAMGNSLLQTVVPDELRGRVMSCWMLVVLGLTPFGSLYIGSLASAVGPVASLVICALVALVCAGAIIAKERELFRSNFSLVAQPVRV